MRILLYMYMPKLLFHKLYKKICCPGQRYYILQGRYITFDKQFIEMLKSGRKTTTIRALKLDDANKAIEAYLSGAC